MSDLDLNDDGTVVVPDRESLKRKIQESFAEYTEGSVEPTMNTPETRQSICDALEAFLSDFRATQEIASSPAWHTPSIENTEEDIKNGILRLSVEVPPGVLPLCQCRPFCGFREGDPMAFCDECLGIYVVEEKSK